MILDSLDPCVLLQRAGIEPDPWQRDVLLSSHPRIMLNCARGSGKTLVAATLALHLALFKPGSLSLLVSPTQKQSREVLRMAIELWKAPEAAVVASKSESLERLELQNGSRIISQPGENPDSIRGFHADLAIIDEAARVTDECFVAVKPTLNIKRGRLLLLSTPFGRRGFFWGEWTNAEANWLRIQVTADECSRIPRDRLEEDRLSFGLDRFQQEYYCVFADAELDIFDMDLIQGAIVTDIPPLKLEGLASATDAPRN